MTNKKGNVLILNADDAMLFTSRIALQSSHNKVVTESHPKRLESILEKEHFDVIVLDLNFSFGLTGGKESIKILKRIFSFYPEAQVLLTADYGETDVALEAIELGAKDYLVKPWSKEKLVTSVNLLFDLSQLQEKTKQSRTPALSSPITKAIEDVIFEGKSTIKKAFEKSLDQLGQHDNMLLLGEKGTTHEVIAKQIHALSQANGRFVSINLADYAQEEQVAFFSANSAPELESVSLVELADSGTLYLENIELISPQAQAILLDTLQFKHFRPAQGLQNTKIELRVIASSTQSLSALKNNEQLKADFLQLLHQRVIHIPSVRTRKDDLEKMIRHLLKSIGPRYAKSNFRLNETTLSALTAYDWPGNYRELVVVCERICQTAKGHLLTPGDFIPYNEGSADKGKELNMDELEKRAIQDAIRANDGNLTKAAQTLGLGRSTLDRKMTKYHL